MTSPMLSLSLSLLFAVGCAGLRSSRSNAPAPLVRGDTRWESCFPGRSYSEAETALMQKMLDDGAPTRAIASSLGGKPQDIRCWQARMQRRGYDRDANLATVANK